MITIPGFWFLHSKTNGRVHGCGPYLTRRCAMAALTDRQRNGHAFHDEKPRKLQAIWRFDGSTVHLTDIDGR